MSEILLSSTWNKTKCCAFFCKCSMILSFFLKYLLHFWQCNAMQRNVRLGLVPVLGCMVFWIQDMLINLVIFLLYIFILSVGWFLLDPTGAGLQYKWLLNLCMSIPTSVRPYFSTMISFILHGQYTLDLKIFTDSETSIKLLLGGLSKGAP